MFKLTMQCICSCEERAFWILGPSWFSCVNWYDYTANTLTALSDVYYKNIQGSMERISLKLGLLVESKIRKRGHVNNNITFCDYWPICNQGSKTTLQSGIGTSIMTA